MGILDGLLQYLGTGGNAPDAQANINAQRQYVNPDTGNYLFPGGPTATRAPDDVATSPTPLSGPLRPYMGDPTGYDLNGPGSPRMMTPDAFAKAARGQELVGAFSHGALPGLASLLFGGGDSTPAYNAMLQGAQATQLQGLGIPAAQFKADVISGRRDLATGQFGAPDGAAPAVAAAPAAMSGADYAQKIVDGESGGDPSAASGSSSSAGLAGFTAPTWLATVRKARPDLAGKSDADLLALRGDAAVSGPATLAFATDNAAALAKNGIPANATTLALAHRFGATGATAMLKAGPDAPLGDVLSSDALGANPDLKSKTTGDVVTATYQRFGAQPVDLGGGGAAAGAAAPATAGLVSSLGGGAPASGVNRILGLPTPGNLPAQSVLSSAIMFPDLLKEFAAGQNATVRGGSYAPDQNGVRVFHPLGEAGVSVPPGSPDFLRQFGAVKATEQGAIGAREKSVAQAKADLDYETQFGAPRPGSADAPLGGKPAAAGASVTSGKQPDGSIITDAGTAVPSILKQGPLPQGGVPATKAIEKWTDTTDAWSKAVPENFVAENRVRAIMDALRATESGQWATKKAEVYASLKAAGVSLDPSTIKSVADVQIALKDNFQTALANAKAFSNRATQLEVMQGSKNFANPDMQPEANHAIGAQAIGTLQQERAMMSDWRVAQANGWKNPQDFELAWKSDPRNALQGFIDRAYKDIGPLKGEQTAPGQASAPVPPQGYDAAKVFNGQTYLQKGGQWYLKP